MGHRKFEPLPDFARNHPQADRYRINRLETVFEEHLEECRQSRTAKLDGLFAYIPGAILFVLGLLGWVSPENAASFLKALGH